ncbi:hypothetical protein AJ80_06097 [Polytolypa hystricis UAMH7299]|uniref:Sulphur transport domain-containing protein n=1 Tax=Polytolypa hystricis (strain UAMH7299) TaxID=1447883 RepID=A0A2B7XZP3_POLH7|nr:hypothetical protein AJ80_06097 [Polytolypa hystricis UAMH7299]
MFTPVDTSLGALLLYQGSAGLLQHTGKVLGISSLLSGSVTRPGWENLPIITGLISSIAPVYLFAPALLPKYPSLLYTWEAAAATVGTGVVNLCGCTSGHMLCGLSRLSPRSLIATGIFFTTAAITANLRNRFPSCADDQPCYLPTFPSMYNLAFMLVVVMLSQVVNDFLVPRLRPDWPKASALYSYIAGFQFGLGLLISGMASPGKVLGIFSLRDFSRFDPSLLLVLVFAVGPSLWSWMRLKRVYGNEKGKKPPTFGSMFYLPTATVADIDWRFILGAISFGVGWGLTGVCPGPGLLRTILQPSWGLWWMTGFQLGNFLDT